MSGINMSEERMSSGNALHYFGSTLNGSFLKNELVFVLDIESLTCCLLISEKIAATGNNCGHIIGK